MALDKTLSPAQQMTGLRYAIDHMKELSKIQDLKLMFDANLMTTDEEILEQGITEVPMKAKEMNMADIIRLQQERDAAQATTDSTGAAATENQPILAQFYINGKGQLIKITEVERRGQMTQMHAILAFDIDQLPQSQHSYSGVGAFSEGSAAGKVQVIKNVPRAKVPVRDGHSQGVSCAFIHFFVT